MWEELERYKAGMVDVARAVGAADVTSTTIVQTTQEMNAKINIQTTIINEFEDRTCTALNDLLAAIEAAPVDQERRKTAAAAIKEVTDAHEDRFFDKFQKFCHGSAGIVGDIAKITFKSQALPRWHHTGCQDPGPPRAHGSRSRSIALPQG
jgi:phytoene/squalene synthetase